METETSKKVDLGSWLGRQHTFAMIAGACTAARAQCLKSVRQSALHDALGLTWEEFCTEYAGISRVHADSLIRQHEAFGDAYFRLSEIARISPKTYKQIEDKVSGDTIEIDGRKLAIAPENAPRIRAAIQALRTRLGPAAPRPAADLVELRIRVDALAGDISNSIHALGPTGDSSGFRSLLTDSMDKFANLSRALDRHLAKPVE